MAGRPKKINDEIDDQNEIEQREEIADEKPAKPVDANDKVTIRKGGVTRIRREGDLKAYLADGWVRA